MAIMQLEMDLKEAEKILSRMCLASPRSRIVVLTMLESPRYVRALSGLGIDAYVHKSSSSEELIGTIGVLSRESNGRNVVVSMPRRLLERLGEEPSGGLSEREMEISGHRRPRPHQ
jgi:DNA-binding NarL/FixJ family response regulator